MAKETELLEETQDNLNLKNISVLRRSKYSTKRLSEAKKHNFQIQFKRLIQGKEDHQDIGFSILGKSKARNILTSSKNKKRWKASGKG